MYFLALTFSPHRLLFKRLDSFRKRFDPSFSKTNLLHMTLLPPFSLPSKVNIQTLIEHLEESIEDYMSGHYDEVMGFSSLDYSFGRKGTLFLTPKLNADFDYCLEGIHEELEHCEVRFKRKRSILSRPYLPLGRYLSREELYHAYKQAHEEFSLPIELRSHKIVLFEKAHNGWNLVGDLFTFEGLGHNDSMGESASFAM